MQENHNAKTERNSKQNLYVSANYTILFSGQSLLSKLRVMISRGLFKVVLMMIEKMSKMRRQ